MMRRSLRSVNFKLAQEFLDDGGDGAAVGETGEGFIGCAHHLAHILDGGGTHLSDDILYLGFHFGLGKLPNVCKLAGVRNCLFV